MEFEALVDFALREGCNTTLAAVRDGERYHNLVQHFRVAEAERSLHARARRAGTIPFGLITTLGGLRGSAPVSAAESGNDIWLSPHSPEDLALVQLLGELLADTAIHLLPPEVLMTAERWGTMSGAEQLQALGAVSEQLAQASADERQGDPTTAEIFGFGFACFTSQRPDNILPQQQLQNGTSDQVNCLGMTQRLVAFARRTGAAHRLLGIVRGTSAMTAQHRAAVRAAVIESGLLNGHLDDLVAERILADLRVQSISDQFWSEMFHSALLIQLADGSWCILDPFFANWGVVDLAEVEEMLAASERGVPGLSLVVRPKFDVSHELAALLEQAQRQIEESFVLLDKLHSALDAALHGPQTTFGELVAAMVASEWFVRLIREFGDPAILTSDPKRCNGHAAYILFGPKGPEGFKADEAYQRRQRGYMDALMGQLIIQKQCSQAADLGRGRGLLPELIEVGHAAFQLGHRTLLDLLTYFDCSDEILERLGRLSNSQPSLTNVAPLLTTTELMLLGLLPNKHWALERKLVDVQLVRLHEWVDEQKGEETHGISTAGGESAVTA